MEGCWRREQDQGQSLSISQPGCREEETSGRQEKARHSGLPMNQGMKHFRLDKETTDPVRNSIRLRKAPRLRMTGPC